MNEDELFSDSFSICACKILIADEILIADGIPNPLSSYYDNKQEVGKGWEESSQLLLLLLRYLFI